VKIQSENIGERERERERREEDMLFGREEK
jgi:hypothetical protein